MDAFDRIGARACRAVSDPERLAWLTPPPPCVGTCVRDADGVRLGAVCALVIDDGGTVAAIEIACSDVRLGRRRVPPRALRAYGDGFVCLYFRRDLEELPGG